MKLINKFVVFWEEKKKILQKLQNHKYLRHQEEVFELKQFALIDWFLQQSNQKGDQKLILLMHLWQHQPFFLKKWKKRRK